MLFNSLIILHHITDFFSQRFYVYSPSSNDDTIKTFCTEGTPLDTPSQISKANSMTDLVKGARVAVHPDEDNPPQLYCVEETPDCLSRADSEEEEADDSHEEKGQLEATMSEKKAVKFDDVTPMVFSRSSSMESLDSDIRETQSIRSGYSSCNFRYEAEQMENGPEIGSNYFEYYYLELIKLFPSISLVLERSYWPAVM